MDRDNRDSRDRDSKVLAGVLAMIRAQDVPVEEHKVLSLAVEELPPELVIDPRYTACVSQSTRAMDNTKRKVIKCVLQEKREKGARPQTKSQLQLLSRVKGERRNHRPGQAQEARGHPH